MEGAGFDALKECIDQVESNLTDLTGLFQRPLDRHVSFELFRMDWGNIMYIGRSGATLPDETAFESLRAEVSTKACSSHLVKLWILLQILAQVGASRVDRAKTNAMLKELKK